MSNTRELMRRLCEKVGLTNVTDGELDENNAELTDTLRSNGLPDHLIAVDGSEDIPALVINHGVGFFLDYENDELHDKNDLSLAAECGVYHALLAEIELSLDKLKDVNVTMNDAVNHFIDLRQHLGRLGKLYWSAGDVHACMTLLQLSNYLANHPESNIFSEKLVEELQEEAIKYFHWAMILDQEPQSVRLSEVMPESAAEEYDWVKSDRGKEVIFGGIEEDRQHRLFKQAQIEMEFMLAPHKANKKY